jgi:hypothetical protein
MMDRSFTLPPLLAEIVGWAAFLVFVALVYRLRQALDRPRRGE